MQTLLPDLRFALRQLLKNPGFTAVAVLTLALGIGANTAIFSSLDKVLLRPLPYHDPDGLVMVWLKGAKEWGGDRIPLSVADLLDWRAHSAGFDGVGAWSQNNFNYKGGDVPEEVFGATVTANLFDILGVKPVLGRTFLPEVQTPGGGRVAVVSERFWRNRLGAEPKVVGQAVTLDGSPCTIVGVMPNRFDFLQGRVELWVAMQLQTPSRRGPFFLRGLARLEPGVTVDQAKASMRVLAARWQGRELKADEGATVLPLKEFMVGETRPVLLLLFGAVTLLLLIASVNVANLALARTTARLKEFSIRAALGANRLTIIRQLLTESLLIAFLGGVCGLVLAKWGTDVLQKFGSDIGPRLQPAGINAHVLGWAAFLSVTAGLLFGLVPALRSSTPNLNEILKEGGRGSSAGVGRRGLRELFVVAEVALALMLLAAAGLLLKSSWRLQQVDPGVQHERVLTAQVSLSPAKYTNGVQRVAFFQELLSRLRTLPGVQVAAFASGLPNRQSWSDGFTIEGQPHPSDGKVLGAEVLAITPDHFRAVGISLQQGRDFTDADREGASRVVIINQALAARFFANQSPIGKRLVTGSPIPDNPFMEIVGVVGDVNYLGLAQEAPSAIYLPYAQNPWSTLYLTIRSVADPVSLVTSVRLAVRELDSDLALADIHPMEDLLSESTAVYRLRAGLITAFTVVAVLLAALGIYAVITQVMAQRTHELGIRMALGAQRLDVLALVLRQGMRLTVAGMAIGLAGAFALTRLLEGMLFGVRPTDPFTYATVIVLLGAVAPVACYLPARRAAKVDPMEALRCE